MKGGGTHGHQGLGDAGQDGGPQRVDQDLVLGDGEHQQGDGVLRAQVLQQHGKPAAAAEETLGTQDLLYVFTRHPTPKRESEPTVLDHM